MCLTINKCMGLSNFCYINNKRKVQIVYTKHSLLITNLHQQQAYTYFQFSDIAENWHFCTLIIVNISVALLLNPKTLDILRLIINRFKRM